MIKDMVSAMKEYCRRQAKRLDQPQFRESQKFLMAISKKIERRRNKMTISAIQFRLQKLENFIHESIQAMESDWELARSSSPTELVAFLWPEIGRTPPRKIELDTQLQIQLGECLATFLTGMTLQTIARLICLAYVVGGLAKIETGKMLLNYPEGKRNLCVNNVAHNLRYAKFQKAEMFKKS